MPGILPMKVIKIGSNSQTRIAQACDRCRSKKIRCDGIRPCCTQCANVGFECKTSDKLSRRAFPRGYTESLEERVRSLEAEVRELKDLLDEKDEKIDMLSRIHSHSAQPIQLPSPRRASHSSIASTGEDFQDHDEPDEIFKVKQSPRLLGQGSDSYFSGTSSARSFVESFKEKAKANGYTTKDIEVDNLLGNSNRRLSDVSAASTIWTAPPRMLSDQLVNIFFQEWAPLFPVLHRPTFLTIYERFVSDPEAISDKASLAHLNLVFAIAAISSGTGAQDVEDMEVQWNVAIDSIMNESTTETLQALVLAQIYCLQKGDLHRLSTYKGLSTTLSARLGLHQVQKSFALDPLTSETRKKLFWTLYTVDCFSSVVLGLPKHIKDDEVSCEYPVDADDEYVTEHGFQPTLPGESTKLSSALALFKAARILSRVLEDVFPAKASYELSLKKLSDLSDELELWEAALPSHLRLHFAQDKPSTGTVTSRSPILSFTYHYIRALIQRPAICSKSLGNKASSSLMVHAGSCKRIIQIMQLLDERGLSFSFCLNKDEVLVLSGVGLLYQRMQLDTASKSMKDNQKSLVAIIDVLNQSQPKCLDAFIKVVQSFIPKLELPTPSTSISSKNNIRAAKPSISRSSSDRVMLSEQSHNLQISARKQLKDIASRFSANSKFAAQRLSVSSLDGLDLQSVGRSSSELLVSPVIRNGFSTSPTSDASLRLSLSHSPPATTNKQYPVQKPKRTTLTSTNLDYLSFGNEPEQESKSGKDGSQPVKSEPLPTDWEKLLGNLDNGTTNIFDACYGGPPIEALADPLLDLHKRSPAAVMSDSWIAAGLTLNAKDSAPFVDASEWSSSRNSIGSTDEHASAEWTSASSSHENDALAALVLADFGVDCDFDIGAEWQDNASGTS